MKVYVDLVLFLNFAFDFLLLLTVSIILKRRTSIKRITLASLFGSITIIILFVPFTTLTLFILKIIISIILVTISYGIKDLKYIVTNLIYFYLTSIILGGFMYYLNIELSYKNIGMVFYHKGIGINYIFILIASPIILYIYSKEMKKLKTVSNLYYKVDVYIEDKIIKLQGFMDTGNTLVDPYKRRKIIIASNKKLKELIKYKKFLLVPYESVTGSGLLKCIKPDKIYVENFGIINNTLIGITDEKLKRNGIDCILNYLLMEEK